MNEKTIQTLRVKNEKLEKLCRALQSERKELGKKLKMVGEDMNIDLCLWDAIFKCCCHPTEEPNRQRSRERPCW